MKKLISILLLGGMVLSLSGCVSQKDYKDLEKRVEYLEQRQGIVQTTYTENNQNDQNNKVNEVNSNTWSLEGMSADEIYNECITLSKSIKTGDNVSIFQSNFRANARADINNNLNFYFDTEEKSIQNKISTIHLNNCIVEMNNTYTIKKDSKVQFDMYITDYDVAATLYNKIYDYLKTLNFEKLNNSDSNDYREGSYWSSSIIYERTEINRDDVVQVDPVVFMDSNNPVYYYTPTYYITLRKLDNPNKYEIIIELPIINE